MRRFVVRLFLPACLCVLPTLAGLLVWAFIPTDAQHHYLRRLEDSRIDWLILALGSVLFAAQLLLAWRALQWIGPSFDEGADKRLSHLATAAEWFPLLGLIGTVAAILQTFSSITPGVTPQEIIRSYGPAITATGSGLFMAFLNILPTWVVLLGRDLIRGLAGVAPQATGAG